MPVNLTAPSALLPIEGIEITTAQAGIKKAHKTDVTLMVLAHGTQVAAVFTRNAFCAAPVQVARAHLLHTMPRALIINTGNANAGTGAVGMQVALKTCQAVAAILDCAPTAVLPFSTGVIGEPKNLDEKIAAVLPESLAHLSQNHWVGAANAIMTTDVVAKGTSRQVEIDGKIIRITGISKGAGMIRPDMATMLAFIATDAVMDQFALQIALNAAVNQSFNRITVDGDTSTNDACVFMATQKAGNRELSPAHPEWEKFLDAVLEVFVWLAQAIVRDGEGATHFIAVQVDHAATEAEALAVAYSVAHSPLVKTACFANDPNWGRILAATGRAGVPNLNVHKIAVWLDEVQIVTNGGRAPSYQEADGARIMKRDEYTIRIDLGRGAVSQTVWTCDFSYDYVKINAEYRT